LTDADREQSVTDGVRLPESHLAERRRIQEVRAEACARKEHIRLYEIASPLRFGWLKAGDLRPSPLRTDRRARLYDIIERCTEASNRLRGIGMSCRGQRIQSYLYSVRAAARHFRGEEHDADVTFLRARAVLRRPSAPGENFASAIALLVQADCALYTARCRFPDGVDLALDHVDVVLRQAKRLLVEGRPENRWCIYWEYLSAFRHYVAVEGFLSRKCDASQSMDHIIQHHIHRSLRHVLAGLSNAGRQSDFRLVLMRLLALLGRRTIKVYGAEAWLSERRRCGIPRGSPTATPSGSVPRDVDLPQHVGPLSDDSQAGTPAPHARPG
jgi:hypothetical protein